MRGTSELFAILILTGVTTITFLASLYILPTYLKNYISIGMGHSLNTTLLGVSTDGHLKRIDSQLIVFIYNHGDNPITINYRVICTSESTYIVGEDNVYIDKNKLYVKTYNNVPIGICYLIVEEPNIIIYKVVES
ncbi:MAG: hypothetical protein QXE70_04420 [Ignisphaera sp.]|uniref:Uncharacterized protein n=1 Tax=Ignisphaera aggregans TaxID=334771 RepID=A0A7C4D136_9CREN